MAETNEPLLRNTSMKKWIVAAVLCIAIVGCRQLTTEHEAGIVVAHKAMLVLVPACVGDPDDPNDGDRRACEEGLKRAAVILDELNTLVEIK